MNPEPSETPRNNIEAIKKYYGKVLKSSRDMKTGICNTDEMPPAYLRSLMRNVPAQIHETFYGCGFPVPPALEGCTLLDLGCGSGRDSYLAAQMVGAKGRVIGIDMTEEQLDIAQRHVDSMEQRLGKDAPKIEFRHGYIEDLRACGIEDESIDVAIADCALNMSPGKARVFTEIFRALKPGGELYFADIFASRRVPAGWEKDPELLAECLAGAMYLEDCRRLFRTIGCPDIRIVHARPIHIHHPDILAKCEGIEFQALTLRVFKIPGLEETAESYGQSACYMGTIPELRHSFNLDTMHSFETACPVEVSANTASILQETRYRRHFQVIGNRATHFGPFSPFFYAPKESHRMMPTMEMPRMQMGAMSPEMMNRNMMPGMMPGMMNGMMPGMNGMMPGMMMPQMMNPMMMPNMMMNPMMGGMMPMMNGMNGMMPGMMPGMNSMPGMMPGMMMPQMMGGMNPMMNGMMMPMMNMMPMMCNGMMCMMPMMMMPMMMPMPMMGMNGGMGEAAPSAAAGSDI